jgi:hypothetical protein
MPGQAIGCSVFTCELLTPEAPCQEDGIILVLKVWEFHIQRGFLLDPMSHSSEKLGFYPVDQFLSTAPHMVF